MPYNSSVNGRKKLLHICLLNILNFSVFVLLVLTQEQKISSKIITIRISNRIYIYNDFWRLGEYIIVSKVKKS